MSRFKSVVSLVVACFVWATSARSEDLELSIQPPTKGKILVAGGGELPQKIREKFISLAGGFDAKILVIPTASELYAPMDITTHGAFLIPLVNAGAQAVSFFHAETREEANAESFVEPLSKANAVWISGGIQTRLSERYSGTKTERALVELLNRGGVIGGTSAGAAVMSRKMIAGGTNPEEGRGFTFLDNCVVDQHFLKRGREDRLLRMLSRHPTCFGIGVDEKTAAVFCFEKKSILEVVGESEVRVYKPRENQEHEAQVLYEGSSEMEIRW